MASIVPPMNKPAQPPSRTADQFVVRFPDGMRDRIADQAKLNNRSMNAEIVARLEQSFDGPVKQSEVEELLQKLNERDDIAKQIAARDHLLSITGVYLRLVVDRVEKSDDELSNHLMDLTGRYADCIVHADFGAAFQVAMELVKVGSQIGILDEQGQVKPEFEHLRPDLPSRPKRIRRTKPNDPKS